MHARPSLLDLLPPLPSGDRLVCPLDDELALVDSKRDLVTFIEPKHVQNRAVDDDAGAVADLGEPLPEHMKNISIRAGPRQPRSGSVTWCNAPYSTGRRAATAYS